MRKIFAFFGFHPSFLLDKLTLDDFRFSAKDDLTLQSLDAFQRAVLFRVCEVVRLCEHDEGIRKGAEHIRDLLMERTKGKDNLLTHEIPQNVPVRQKELPQHPLLPRQDKI